MVISAGFLLFTSLHLLFELVVLILALLARFYPEEFIRFEAGKYQSEHHTEEHRGVEDTDNDHAPIDVIKVVNACQ